MGKRAKGIFGSLPILAAAFGRSRGITVSIGGSRAWVDGTRIQLPDLPIDCDEELEAKAMGFLFHETGHMEFTDPLVKLDCDSALELSLYRAIEDVRMEAARNATYPGSPAALAKMVGYIAAEGWFGTAETIVNEPPHQTLSFGILVKLRADYLGQPLGDLRDLRWQRVRDLIGDAGMVKLEVLLDRMDEMDTTADGLMLVKAIATLLQSIADEPEEEQKTDSSDDEAPPEDGGDEGEGSAGNGDSRPASDDDGGSAHGGSPDGGKDPSDSSGPSAGGDTDGNTQPEAGGDQPSAPDREAIRQALAVPSDSDEAGPSTDIGEAVAQSLSSTANEATAKAGNLTASSKQSLVTRPRVSGGEGQEVAGSSRALRTRLTAVMDAKARTRVTHRRTGTRIDSGKLHRLFTGNTRVFVRKDHVRKVNTAVQVLLDRSSSMGKDGRMVLARKAALASAMGIGQIHGCKVAVAAFPGTEVLKDFDEQTAGVSGRFVIGDTGTTPMGSAMLAVAPGLAARREERKLLIVVTDGGPDDPERVRHLINLYEASGVEVVGVGIQTNAGSGLFPSWTVVNALEELSTSLFDVIKGKLKRAA